LRRRAADCGRSSELGRRKEGSDMAAAVTPVPPGYEGITPYLIARNASAAIEFYTKAFGAEETYRLAQPDGRVGHAEIRIGGAVLMLADEFPEMGIKAPPSLGGTPVSLLIYVQDVDAAAARAVAAGAKVKRPVKDQVYGDRSGTFEDPFGHVWTLATRKEDLTPEEIDRRAKTAFGH
jgi:PhnB protein